jgi:toxin ParE1/3/4
MPGMGSLWKSNNPQFQEMRMWPIHGFDNHLIFYRPIEGGIEVIRVLQAARDFESIWTAPLFKIGKTGAR